MMIRKKIPPPLSEISLYQPKRKTPDSEEEVDNATRKGKSPRCPALPTPGSLLSCALGEMTVNSLMSLRRPGDATPLVDDNLFELMEAGFSPTLWSALTAINKSAGVRLCYVEEVKVGKESVFNLMDSGSDAFCMSAKRVGKDTFFSLYRDFSRNCAVMHQDEPTHSFTLVNSGCELCDADGERCGQSGGDRQRLGLITHGQVMAGGLMAMYCKLPGLVNDRRTCWCPRTAKQVGPGLKVDKVFPAMDDQAMSLNSKKAKWNAKNQSYTLDFGGRVKLSSSRNFQLVHNEKIVLQFGQIDDVNFALDFRHPLCMLQAFAIAMSTLQWE